MNLLRRGLIASVALLLLAGSAFAGGAQTYRKLSTSTYHVVFCMVDSADHVTPKTGLTVTVTLSKNAGSFNAASGAVTEIANGCYKLAANATDTGTLGTVVGYATATGADPAWFSFEVVTNDPFTYPDTSSTIATVTTATTATTCTNLTTNNDKTGYSLSQAFPANFSAFAITSGGAVTAGTVSDKTGYSLSQSFPANFASLAITAGGAVTAGTVSDKTGYSLSQAFPSNFSSLGISGTGHISNVDTLTTYTGNTPQTGDAYARLGAPAGASVSADIAALKVDTSGIKIKTDQLVFTVANQVDANALTGGGGATAAQIWAYLTTSATTSGSMGAYILQQLALITSGSVTIRPPVQLDGTLELVAGDSYTNAEGTAIDFSVGSKPWPIDLTGYSCSITVDNSDGTTLLTDTLSVVTATGTSRKVRWEPTASKTNVSSGSFKYEVKCSKSAEIKRLELGVMRIRAGTT